MVAASRRFLTRTTILIAILASIASAQLLEFRAAFGSASPTGGTASFVSVEALPESAGQRQAQAYAGGFFTGNFSIGGAPSPFPNPNGQDGVLVRFIRDIGVGTWAPTDVRQVFSTANARITDVALDPGELAYVTGVFENDAFFFNPLNPITLNTQPPGQIEGFVAWTDGFNWQGAFPVRGMEPNSIALDDVGNIYVTGRPDLARCYDQAGNELWATPQAPGTNSLRHIAVSPAGGPNVYVQGSGGGANEDVFVTQLDQFNGQENWTVNIASGGQEHPGGLGIGPLGNIRTALSSDGTNLTVDGIPIRERPQGEPGRHGHLIFLDQRGSYLRDNLLGTNTVPDGNMETHDLSIDAAGNNYVAITYTGQFRFLGVPHPGPPAGPAEPGQENAGVVAIDTAGAPMRFSDTLGPAQAFGNAVGAADRNLQVLVGALGGTGQENFDSIPLAADQEDRAYFSTLEESPGQQSFILTSNVPGGEPLDVMVRRVNSAGGQVYRALDLPNEGVRLVSADLTSQQLGQLDNFFNNTPDLELSRDGTVSSTWQLAALNSITGPTTSYTYPETCQNTVLYLIDTSIDDFAGNFGANTNLTLASSLLVRAIGEPGYASAFDHGTEMLSMIAGPTYGAAQGTPITVINYDIYPDGVTAKLSALVEAISLANSDKAANYLYDPAVYCVASSATTPGASTSSLDTVVDYAIGPAVYSSIIFSAGNTAGNAEDYTPSDLGSMKSGVITAGAIKIDETQLAGTRGKPGVDLWAPGDAVPAADRFGSPTTVSGTSPATALAAGTALAYLSGNPHATPAALETAMVSTHGQTALIGQVAHVPLSGVPGFTDLGDWAGWFGVSESGNDDGDHWSDEEEYIFGLDPLSYDYVGTVTCLSYDHETETLTYGFTLSCALYQPSALTTPHTLRNGATLTVERSSNLQKWSEYTGALVEGDHADGRIKVSFDYPVNETRCFFRFKVELPPS